MKSYHFLADSSMGHCLEGNEENEEHQGQYYCSAVPRSSPCSSGIFTGGRGGGRLSLGEQDFRLHLHLPVGSTDGSSVSSGSSPKEHVGGPRGGHKETHPTFPVRPLQLHHPVQDSSAKRSHGSYMESPWKHGFSIKRDVMNVTQSINFDSRKAVLEIS